MNGAAAVRLRPQEHDARLIQMAMSLVAQGYAVKARLDGLFESPDVINGYRPDIVARKAEETLIVEVKKGEVDQPKLIAFRHFVEAHAGCHLHIIE
jgi:predicted RecB family endonuclease